MRTILASICAAALLAASRTEACDLCAIYTGSLLQQGKTGLRLGVSEQYTDFGGLRTGDDDLPNPANEWMHSSITQVIAGWTFAPNFGVQANVPLISREYRRLEDGSPVRGDAGGLGDVSVIAQYSPISRAVANVLVHVELFAGLKLPTGNSDRLAEELEEHHDDGDLETHHDGEHDEQESAVHGHDLALGSGSVDGLFGASMHTSWKRLFAAAALQYVVRGNGEFSYEYANDLTWEAGPGVYLFANDSWTAAAGLLASGENKGRDHQKGELADDTAITAVYLGPDLAATWKDSLRTDLVLELPVLQRVTGIQIVPDYRLRAALVWRL